MRPCRRWRLHVAHAHSWSKGCTVFDPEQVYVHGAAWQAAAAAARSPSPRTPRTCVRASSRSRHLGVRPSDGAIITASEPFTFESDMMPMAVRVQRPDPFVFDFDCEHYVSPDDAWKNDHTLATICPDHPAVMSFDQILMSHRWGRPRSPVTATTTCFQATKWRPATTWSHTDTTATSWCARRSKPMKHGVLYDEVFTPLDMQWGYAEQYARSRSGGFWLAIANKSSNVTEQVKVDDDGSTQVVGEYAAAPAPYPTSTSGGVLDAQGRLWQIGGERQHAVRSLLSPAEARSGRSRVLDGGG